VNPELPAEAVELAAAASKAFDALGGVDVARRAETDPGIRSTEVAPALAQLGIDDLDPRAGDLALSAAAALCEAAGRVALPYPVAAALVRDADGSPTVAVPADRARVDHGDLFDRWRVGSLDGAGGVATEAGAPLGTRLGPFVTDLTLSPGDPPAKADLLLQLTLGAWTILGTVDRAIELAVDHVTTRIQFGKPISTFQAVQFQLADASVAVLGLRELAGFTLWRLGTDPSGARADVLALRLHALEVARSVLRTTQQLHGAAGVCDEYDISVLVRMVQPALRLPCGVERTVDQLAAAIATDGFDGLFPHGAAR
jgi:hypothetical protein